MQLYLHELHLQLRYPFRISRSTRTVQENLVVELRQEGIAGYGEAASNAYYGTSLPQLKATLEHWRPHLEREPITDTSSFWNRWYKRLANQPFLLAALDMAAHDLLARSEGKTIRQFLNLPEQPGPLTSYTLGLDTPEKMLEKMAAQPWPVYKIKLGGPEDLTVLQTLRQATTAPFRIDANAGWSLEKARALLPELLALGVELVEQPLPTGDWAAMQLLKSQGLLPFFADESFDDLHSLDACSEAFNGINIKLMKCGGITPALTIIQRARTRGLQVMLGCMASSSILAATAAQLLPLVDVADLDGPLLFTNDPGQGLRYQQGQVLPAQRPGNGLELDL